MNKELKVLVEKLCEDLTSALNQRFEHTIGVTTHSYSVGQKSFVFFRKKMVLRVLHGDLLTRKNFRKVQQVSLSKKVMFLSVLVGTLQL